MSLFSWLNIADNREYKEESAEEQENDPFLNPMIASPASNLLFKMSTMGSQRRGYLMIGLIYAIS